MGGRELLAGLDADDVVAEARAHRGRRVLAVGHRDGRRPEVLPPRKAASGSKRWRCCGERASLVEECSITFEGVRGEEIEQRVLCLIELVLSLPS